MSKKKILKLVIIFFSVYSVFLICKAINSYQDISKLRSVKFKSELESIAIQYYTYMFNREYSNALGLINYDDNNLRDIDLNVLNKNNKFYLIKDESNADTVQNISYNKEKNAFVIECNLGVYDSTMKKYEYFNEILYVKKISGKYKIFKIDTAYQNSFYKALHFIE